MSRFLIGLFTHHVVTKIVSLLLAIVLFVFVQQSISETQRIERLTIRFELTPELDKQWVLLENEVVIKDLSVSGLRESLTREMSALRSKEGFRFKMTIDGKFLGRHPPENGIVIDAALCRQEDIPWPLGQDFELRIENPPTLAIEGRKEIAMRPRLSEEMKERLKLPEGYKFELTGPVVFNEPRAIAFSGPASALPEGADDSILDLFVKIDPLKQALDKVESEQQARDPLFVAGIDWEKSGFKIDQLRYVRVEQPSDVSMKTLAGALSYTCSVETRRVPLVLTIPLQYKTAADSITQRSILADEYTFTGAAGIIAPKPTIDAYRTVAIDLEVTPRWLDHKDELAGYLALLVDLTAGKKGDPLIAAPISLLTIGNAPPGLLGEVRLARGADPSPEEFRFKKTQQ